MFDEPFDLIGQPVPQGRDEPETWRLVLDEKCGGRAPAGSGETAAALRDSASVLEAQ